jgi:hypothetical protein
MFEQRICSFPHHSTLSFLGSRVAKKKMKRQHQQLFAAALTLLSSARCLAEDTQIGDFGRREVGKVRSHSLDLYVKL